MERRSFLKNIATIGAGVELLPDLTAAPAPALQTAELPTDVGGSTLLCEFPLGSDSA